jgi:hypothetical protein
VPATLKNLTVFCISVYGSVAFTAFNNKPCFELICLALYSLNGTVTLLTSMSL